MRGTESLKKTGLEAISVFREAQKRDISIWQLLLKVHTFIKEFCLEKETLVIGLNDLKAYHKLQF